MPNPTGRTPKGGAGNPRDTRLLLNVTAAAAKRFARFGMSRADTLDYLMDVEEAARKVQAAQNSGQVLFTVHAMCDVLGEPPD